MSILNDVDYTQVCVALEDDLRTQALTSRLHADGRVLASGSRWHDRAVLRFSVSNPRTSPADVATVVDAVRRCLP